MKHSGNVTVIDPSVRKLSTASIHGICTLCHVIKCKNKAIILHTHCV
jgi:hypothetical protein